jgi:hypothetical protein
MYVLTDLSKCQQSPCKLSAIFYTSWVNNDYLSSAFERDVAAAFAFDLKETETYVKGNSSE